MEEDWENEELVEEMYANNPPYNIDELTKEDVLSNMVMDYLVSIKNPADRIRQMEKVKDKAKEFKVANAFKTIYKQKDDAVGIKNLKENEIKAMKIGRQYKIPKANIISYIINRN